jgi:hypothetical protein
MRWLNCLVVASLAVGSAGAFRTWHELEGSLAGRSTFAFSALSSRDEPSSGSRHRVDRNLHERIRDELRRQLGARGYSGTTPREAHLLLSFSVGGAHQRQPRSRERRAAVPAARIGRASLAVHLLDPPSGLVIWRGWDDAAIGAGCERDGLLADAVGRIMAALPAARA